MKASPLFPRSLDRVRGLIVDTVYSLISETTAMFIERLKPYETVHLNT